MLNNDIQEIEIEIEEAIKKVRLGQLVTKFQADPEFIELVTEGYFRDDAARLVMLKADKSFQTPEKQAKLDADMLGISVFGEYLRTKRITGIMAADAIKQNELTREELIRGSV